MTSDSAMALSVSRDFMIEEKADDQLSGLLSASGIDSNPSEFFEVKPFRNFHLQVAEKLGMPISYYNKMVDNSEHHTLLNQNVNHWLNIH